MKEPDNLPDFRDKANYTEFENLTDAQIESGVEASVEMSLAAEAPRGILETTEEGESWDDLSGPLIAANIDLGSGRINYDYINAAIVFQNNARYPDEPLVVPVQFRHSQKIGAGTILKPHIHWLQTESNVPNFLLAYKITNQGSLTTIDSDYSNYTFLTTSGNAFTYVSGVLQQISHFPDIDVSSVTLSGTIDFVLFRDTANASGLFAGSDPVSGDARARWFDCHAKFNGLGSKEPMSK